MFNVGDLVQLKSGGPAMTVAGIDSQSVDCTWFDGPKLTSGSFIAGTLKKYEPPTQRNFGGSGPQ